mgnify:CR=1 FL=1
MNKKLSITLVLFLIITNVFIVPVTKATTGNLVMHAIDFDDCGDSILIQLPNGKNMLIDAAHSGTQATIVRYIQGLGITKLDYVIGTHSHADHIGGMASIINSFNIGKYWQPNDGQHPSAYTDVVNALNAKGLSVTRPVAGSDLFNFGDLTCTILAPNGTGYNDLNDYSMVLKLVYKNRSILLTGDASLTSEGEMLSHGYNLTADVLKVGHHGGNTSCSDSFLDAVQPSYAIITADVENEGQAKNPSGVTLKKLETRGIPVYRVDECGTVVCTTDGTNISFNTAPGDYQAGAQLPENQLPASDWTVSDNKWLSKLDNTFDNGVTGWNINEGVLDDHGQVALSCKGGSYQVVTEGSNKYIQLSRNGNEYRDEANENYGELALEKNLGTALTGNITVEAKVKVAANPNPDARTGKVLIRQEGGVKLLEMGFDSSRMYLNNIGNNEYPGTVLKSDLVPGQWYTVKLVINTRAAKFDTYVDGVELAHRINLFNVFDTANVRKVVVGVNRDITTFSVDDVRVYAEAPMFADGFESNDYTIGGWNSSGCAFGDQNFFHGVSSAKFNSSDTLTKALSTVGRTGIKLEYARMTKDCEEDDHFISEWYDGSSWTTLEDVKGTHGWALKTWSLPAGADNNANFKIRFKTTHNDTEDYAFLDNVEVRETSIATPTPTPPPLFSDNFEDGDSAGWTVGNGTFSVVTDGSTKAYYVDNSSSTAKSSAGQTSWSNYTVEVQAKVNTWDTTDGKLGVMARFTDISNHYLLYYEASSRTMKILKRQGGANTVIGTSAVISPPTAGVYHRFKFQVSGSALSGYLDDVPCVSATDSALSNGCIGCYSNYEQAHFDNVFVY